MKLGKRIAAIALAGAMIVGHSVAAFAALSGFTVTDPSLTYLNGKYITTGGVSYKPTSGSGTYYLQDVVTAYRKVTNGYEIMESKAGYGWNAASAVSDGVTTKPDRIENVGSYKSGGSFVKIDTKIITYK